VILSRRMTVPMIKYFNDAGAVLQSRFPATFADFSKRQDFTATGFNLDTGTAAVEPFADFAEFSDVPDFAAFAGFGDNNNGTSTEPAASSEPVADDFAPSEFLFYPPLQITSWSKALKVVINGRQ
jgi:hypothetical protein